MFRPRKDRNRMSAERTLASWQSMAPMRHMIFCGLSVTRIRYKIGPNVIGDKRGSVAAEFAIILVPFMGLLAGVFEVGSLYFRAAQLQAAAEAASRSLLVNGVSTASSYDDFINKNVCTWKNYDTVAPGTLSPMFDCDKVFVSVQSLSTWTGWNNDTASSITVPARTAIMTPPGPGEIIVVRILYPVSPIMGIIAGSSRVGIANVSAGLDRFQNQSVYVLMGVTVFRSEPTS